MAKEIERKFLVKSDGWKADAVESNQFLQAYIASGDDRSIRVRIVDGERARLTIKIGRDMLVRDEFEYDIPLADAEELARAALGTVLKKTRYKVPCGSHVWEIDVYSGDYDGLVVAEVEMAHAGEAIAIPDWIGREVTDNRHYSNMTMATEDVRAALLETL